jgi:hypothetical protein
MDVASGAQNSGRVDMLALSLPVRLRDGERVVKARVICAISGLRQRVLHWVVVDPDDVQAQQEAAETCLHHALREELLEGPRPVVFYSDSGAPFHRLETLTAQYPDDSLRVVKVQPGRPRGRGTVEKASFQDALLQFTAMLPGYTDSRGAFSDRGVLLSRDEFVHRLEEFFSYWNAARGGEVDKETESTAVFIDGWHVDQRQLTVSFTSESDTGEPVPVQPWLLVAVDNDSGLVCKCHVSAEEPSTSSVEDFAKSLPDDNRQAPDVQASDLR